MANLTLSLDDAILQKAREAAVREHTSVNALVRDFLTHYAGTRERRLAALDTLDTLAAHTKSRSTRAWSREQLHQR